MNSLKLLLIVLWCVIAVITVQAVSLQGMAAGDIFLSDIRALDWRAQFNVDFFAHLLLMGLWVAWRSCFSALGIVLGMACVLGGGLVSLVYLLVAAIRCGGDVRRLLLGQRAAEE